MARYAIAQLQEQLAQAGDSKTKAWWEAYLKHSLPFRGLKLPQVRSHIHSWAKTTNFSSQTKTQQFDIAIALIRESWGEDKLAGILLLQEFLIKNRLVNWESDLPEFAKLFDEDYIKEWNTCDWFCVKVLNPLIKQQGKPCAVAVMQWCEAENLWRKRATIVSFVSLAKYGESNFPGFSKMLLDTCGVVIQSSERFAQTGTGWCLRELGLSDRNLVIDFIKANSNYFSSEGLRYAIEKFPPDLQTQLKQYRQEKLKKKNR